MPMLAVVLGEEVLAVGLAEWIEANWPGKPGRYFMVLNWGFRVGVFAHVRRECEWVMPGQRA
jgi:hypothetical protein